MFNIPGFGVQLRPDSAFKIPRITHLWQEQVYRSYVPEATGDAWALDARGEYGVRLRSGGLLTWFGSLSHAVYGRQLMVGGRLGVFSPDW